MLYTLEREGHQYYYEVHNYERAALVSVRTDGANAQGAFIVTASGHCEPAGDLPGFRTNPLRVDGMWPEPPREAIADACRVAQAVSK